MKRAVKIYIQENILWKCGWNEKPFQTNKTENLWHVQETSSNGRKMDQMKAKSAKTDKYESKCKIDFL